MEAGGSGEGAWLGVGVVVVVVVAGKEVGFETGPVGGEGKAPSGDTGEGREGAMGIGGRTATDLGGWTGGPVEPEVERAGAVPLVGEGVAVGVRVFSGAAVTRGWGAVVAVVVGGLCVCLEVVCSKAQLADALLYQIYALHS